MVAYVQTGCRHNAALVSWKPLGQSLFTAYRDVTEAAAAAALPVVAAPAVEGPAVPLLALVLEVSE